MRIALMHDYLTQYGGAERVLDEFHAIWPEAPVFTTLYEPDLMPAHYRTWDIRISWLDRVPFARRKHQALLPLYPGVIESLDFSDYDVVVSSSSGFAHGVLTGPDTTHICYCHSPPRFLWDFHNYARREGFRRLTWVAAGMSLAKLRVWDRISAERVDCWVTTGRVVQDRIKKFYGKESVIIPPPVDLGRFDVGQGDGGYYLMLMRLVGWKRPDIVIEACSRLGLKLIVAGDGRDEARLRKLSGPTVQYVGRVDNVQMRALYARCIALILPSEEDFGITPLEAMASGRPVIAFARGGALETVLHGRTGIFFADQTVDSLMSVLVNFDANRFEPYAIRKHCESYDSVLFREAIKTHVESHYDARSKRPWRSAAGEQSISALALTKRGAA